MWAGMKCGGYPVEGAPHSKSVLMTMINKETFTPCCVTTQPPSPYEKKT